MNFIKNQLKKIQTDANLENETNETNETNEREPETEIEKRIQKMIDELETNDGSHFLETATIESIQNDIATSLDEIQYIQESYTESNKRELCESMRGYRRIYQVNEIEKSRPTKLIDCKTSKIIYAGFLLNIEFTNNSINLVCKKGKMFYSRYRFDKYLIFQKLNNTEMMILSLKDNI
jgi:hypothetical protein